MKRIYNLPITALIRLSILLSLIFFACSFLSCGQKQEDRIKITWKDQHAAGIEIPTVLLRGADEDSITHLLQVRLSKAGGSAMFGDYTLSGDVVRFTPMVPLSRGLQYEIFFRNRKVGEVVVPFADNAERPVLEAIYPRSDSLPENLLKFYIRFSSGMRTSEWQKHIALTNEHNDTLPDIFLDLELWNKEGSTLTLWLDPGRIKRELIPNMQFGNPLMKGRNYTLHVSAAWMDVQDRPLANGYRKEFTVIERDSLSPDPADWSLKLPDAGSLEPLVITFGEPLDYYLLQETIRISNEGGKVPGKIEIAPEEKSFVFIPDNKWKAGDYRIHVEAILEDLAGNNLERVFDRDTRNTPKRPSTGNFERRFQLVNRKQAGVLN